jgi:hypothetical protein
MAAGEKHNILVVDDEPKTPTGLYPSIWLPRLRQDSILTSPRQRRFSRFRVSPASVA